MNDRSDRQIEHSNYEMFILALSILSLANILVILLSPSILTKRVVATYDFLLAFGLLGDFIIRLIRAPDKAKYFFKDFGWLDFLGSLPINGFRIARLFRIIRVIRQMQKLGAKKLVKQFSLRRAASTLLGVVFYIILALELASVLILHVELPADQANILTPSDALWWTFVTITTVGYGDHYPVTEIGRGIGLLLMISGITLFGVLTGYLANAFTRPEAKIRDAQGVGETDDLHAKLAEIMTLLEEQDNTNQVLKEQLRAIERQL